MSTMTTPRPARQGGAGRAPDTAPSNLHTTLYDVMAALQSVVEPHADALVVAIVARWLRTKHITFARDATLVT